MERKEFNFTLPKHLIAQTPLENREKSRLMCVEKNPDKLRTGKLEHHHFYELPKILRPGDCLVLNDSRVIPARLLGKRETGGTVEVVLLHEVQGDGGVRWECLTRPGKKTMPGTKLVFGNGELTGTVMGTGDGGNKIIEFDVDGIFMEVLERLGKMPLPPYIHEELMDAERYQTVYSRESGSAAAPTAGLHFTHELLDEIKANGVEFCYLTLHVGLGTFRPVKAENIEDHEMHAESYTISKETADTINRAKQNGGRVIAVGTTSCRTLESIADDSGLVTHGSGDTDIFIYPGYKFKCMDGLITNFHLPESTLIMLVSAFAGSDNILNAYKTAIEKEYRFFSFGDAMLII
ncbi:MAG: tRNA preQ1(34) S-adenosylmethionine ribosyltransferase-isomerase QueA [Oscillospiraceae bacterium]|nr:tRNA preQ1(34) S-adenosylmethionine ribosyltransferase-isomerase QueA [Oscillospiraceae bacterium]MCL2279036.1 tRNA preQ1(34) S-adenosylmethionine ribosyltransferase-isomerase QueA [Oscillospiraceae bacterium]